MNREVFYQVTSGNKTLPVYDVDAHQRIAAATTDLDGLSGKVEELSGKHETLSGKVDDTIEDLEALSAKHEELSGKFETLSGEFDDLTDTVDEIDRDLDALSAKYEAHAADDVIHVSQTDRNRWDEVTQMVYSSAFNEYQQQVADEFGNTSAWANETFQPVGEYVTSADFVEALTNYYTKQQTYSKEEIDELISNFAGFEICSLDPNTHEPDVEDPKSNIIYLAKDPDAQIKDPYEEWIYDEGWECIGEMSVPLENYYTKSEVNQKFVEVYGWASGAFQPAGDYVSGSEFDTFVDTVNETFDKVSDDLEQLDAEKLDVSAASAWDVDPYVGDDTFIKVQGHEISFIGNIPQIPGIVGLSGLSATFDSSNNQYKVAISGYNDAAFAKFHTSANVCDGTSAKIDGYNEDLNLNDNKVAVSSNKIYVQPGLYHVDMQATLAITATDNQYYETTVKALAAACADTKNIDASFLHSETVDLSYDIQVTDADTPLETSIEGFIGTIAINNLNIHEIIQMPAKINGAGGNYVAGDGIGITNSTISVKAGKGLWVPTSSNNLEVKLGNGLTFTNEGGINALTIDEKTEAVVATVEKLSEDLDSKVTVNMPFADVTTRHDGSTYFQQYNTGSACCIAQLFSVPINNKLYVSADGAKTATCISIMSNQSYNGKVIFGLFEYVYDAGGGNGDTNWVGDTGPVSWDGQGRHEFPLIHMVEGAELKAENVYYAVMCAPTDNIGNMWLAGTTTGYAPTFNTHPLMTFGFGNAKTKSGDGIDFTTTAGTLQNIDKSYNEAGHGNPRFFMQIRNKKIAGA